MNLMAQEPLDLRDVLAVAAEAMRPIAAEHHPIVVDGGDEEVQFTGDRIRLTTIVTNLIDNAFGAMNSGGGTLTLRTRRDGDRLVVEIADTGSGIPPEIRPRIFEPFFSTKPVGEGTGLGLDISYRIVVNRHHGDIQVESEPGRTVLRVYLPVEGSDV